MKPTLIIADDVKAILEELTQILQEDFDIVGLASDGMSAVDLALSFRPDLILMDVMMPKRSGIEAARMISEKLGASPKIVMLSGLRDERVVLSAFQAGASDYLFKPIDQKKISSVLWACWRGKIRDSVA